MKPIFSEEAMIVVFDLNGVFFTNGFTLAVKRIADHVGKKHEHIENIFSTPEAKAYRAGVHDPGAFWESVSGHFDDISVIKELLFSSYVPIPEAHAFFQRLRKAGIMLGFLSNSPHDRFFYLEQKHRFRKHFDFGIFSFEAGAQKPERPIYEKLIERCGVLSPEVIFVDDKEENLVPARELGMSALLFTNFYPLEVDLKKLGLKF